MQPYALKKEELLLELSADAQNGLSDQQVRERLEQYGPNKLKEKKKKSLPQRFFDQFKDAMILILLAAAAVSFTVAIVERSPGEFFEPALIVLIVLLNAVMGLLQESKAEKALEALQNLSAPHARVIRSGKEEKLDAAALVPGDLILLEAGDYVPADARILESASLKSEEAALTGESVPSEKDAGASVQENAPIGDRLNMLYTGCSVTYGTAKAVVTATGMDTEMGRIAGLLEGETSTQTPLQEKLAKLGRNLGFLALGACAVIFAIGLFGGVPLMEIFMTAVSLAVSAIPEGLPAIVTIVLSLGVQRMVRKNAIIRRLPAVETLGSASVICSDKTGTLTQNRMTLVKAYTDGQTEEIGERNSAPVKKLLQYAALCSDASVRFETDGEKHIGDPTETAILVAAHKNGMEKDQLNEAHPRRAQIPFDSDRKLMSTVNEIDGKNIVIVKGAFDVLSSRCVSGDIDAARTAADSLSAQALRVLAVACKEIGEVPASPKPQELEQGLVFMGLVGMIDPPRPEAKEAVEICRSAGIKPVMITGDHVITASAIAKELGILLDGDDALTGAQLGELSERELLDRVETISVYARVSPEDKIRIVHAWQKKGRIVSMTGDGVNDAPALKAADIGCAMGITGTDVAKGAADMTLTDDNFATIVDAVKEGRGIYDNIKKAVGFLLGTNIGEVLAVFFAMLFWHQSPLISIQLLWINLVTDSLPAIALGMEPLQDSVMQKPPKPKDEGIFAHGFGVQIILQGVMFGVLTLIGFYLGWKAAGDIRGGRTMAFTVLAFSQLLHAFNMRSERSLFKTGWFSNKYLNGAVLISLILVAAVVFIPPVAAVFGMMELSFQLYLTAFGMALLPIVALEISKAFRWIR
ncbi:calcium-translocating P-type ATPase, PMCA-type [Candidatus Soleaferrea massiliensis]|uniref:calcium-translocating P-type ATPase, PMCA-type n=1 Tax=Candidatus Soleaferrea massiliensis TaxID=1470354 RepID=UPI00058CFB8C|nr:calcium-translocating P-type ATPase, PMCA-type [Candidatus Soleaferrea massiliensis]